jgi:hypothetical protein
LFTNVTLAQYHANVVPSEPCLTFGGYQRIYNSPPAKNMMKYHHLWQFIDTLFLLRFLDYAKPYSTNHTNDSQNAYV